MSIQLGSKLKDRFDEEYKLCVKAFFEGLPKLGVTDEEMNAVPSSFCRVGVVCMSLPCSRLRLSEKKPCRGLMMREIRCR